MSTENKPKLYKVRITEATPVYTYYVHAINEDDAYERAAAISDKECEIRNRDYTPISSTEIPYCPGMAQNDYFQVLAEMKEMEERHS